MLVSRSNSVTSSIDTMKDGEINAKCKANIGTQKKCVLANHCCCVEPDSPSIS